jgi:hypothetical protein
MGDVNKYLLQGNNAAAKIKTMSSILGDETMGGLRQSYLNQLAEMAPADATKALRKIPADVRQEFFGAELDGRLTAASDVYEKSVANAKQAAKAQKDYASTAADEAVSRNGVQATFDRQAATAEAQQETVRIANDYKTAADNAKATFNTQNAPYSTDFSKAISNGTVGDQLGKGQIATADVNALRAALDPADYDKIKQGVINQQMQASTTAGHFNPVKFMDWYDNIPEPTRNAFFPDSTGTMPINVPAIQDAAKMQRLARAGIIAPVAAGGATLVTVLPHTAFAVLLETAAATGATYFGKEWAANLLDRLATSPRLLNTMAKVAPTVKAAAGATRVATRAATLAGPVLGPSFGRQVTVDGQPGTQVGIHPDSGKPVIMYHPQGAQ